MNNHIVETKEVNFNSDIDVSMRIYFTIHQISYPHAYCRCLSYCRKSKIGQEEINSLVANSKNVKAESHERFFGVFHLIINE